MKRAVQSLFTAIQRSHKSPVRVEIPGAQAQEAPMSELSAQDLRFVAGGGAFPPPGPHGSWDSN